MELELDCLAPSMRFQKACSYKCQFCTKVCASRLVSQVHMMAGKNIKKVVDVSDPNQNIEITCNSKLKFT